MRLHTTVIRLANRYDSDVRAFTLSVLKFVGVVMNEVCRCKIRVVKHMILASPLMQTPKNSVSRWVGIDANATRAVSGMDSSITHLCFRVWDSTGKPLIDVSLAQDLV